MFKFESQCSPKQAQFCLENRKFLVIPSGIGLEGAVALLILILGFYWVGLIKSAWYKFSIFSRALMGLFAITPICVCSSGVLYQEMIIGLLHILEERGLMKTYHMALIFFYRLRFCLKQFMFPKLVVRCKTSGSSCSSWALTGDSTIHQNACPPFLTKSAGHKEAFCVLCYSYKWAPTTTEHRGFVVSAWTVFLLLRSGVVAGEQLLCNNLSGFLCVSSWNWCLNSFSFVRLHWFCSSPKSWLCTGLACSWARGYHAALELQILFTAQFSYFCIISSSVKIFEIELQSLNFAWLLNSILLQTVLISNCCGMLPVMLLFHYSSLSAYNYVLSFWSVLMCHPPRNHSRERRINILPISVKERSLSRTVSISNISSVELPTSL